MKKWKKWKNWLSAAVLAAVFGVGLLTAQTETLKAEPAPYDRRGHISPDERLNLSRARAGKADPKAWRRINGICYNGSGKPISGAVTRGIDVSEWQGRIDWQKVKKSDVDFAFIRISHGLRHMDETFDYNMEQAELAGLPAGAYIYSEATTTTTALKEAQLAIQKLKGYKVSYPVVFDLEDAATMGKLSPTEVSKVALTFCDEIRKAGYVPMLYMNLNWYNNKVDWTLLKDSGLDIWAASYGDTINAPDRSRYTYGIWQCTDGNEEVGLNTTKKLVDGIPPENNVDMNFGFVDYTTKVVPRWEPKADYVPSAKPLYPDTTVTVKNGLVIEGGKTYYYSNGNLFTGWKKIKGKYYFFDRADGHMCKSQAVYDKGSFYCVDRRGVRVAGKIFTLNGQKYYLGKDGKAITGIVKRSGKYYFYDPQTGYMRTNFKQVTSRGTIFYYGKDGVQVRRAFVPIVEKGKRNVYYFGYNGKAYKGWHKINGKKYYFYGGKGPKAGTRAQNVRLVSSGGVVSVFNKYGILKYQFKKK